VNPVDYMLVKAELVVDQDGAVWVMWADNPQRPWQFHCAILADQHGRIVPGPTPLW
jgi:hypothetical protein